MRGLALLVVVCGCFTKPPDVDYDANPNVHDAAPADAFIDASPSCTPNTTVCDDATGHYVQCSNTGTVVVEMDCPLGCSTTSEQCVDVDPSNGLAQYLDMARTAPDVAFTGSSSINTTNGIVFNGANSITVPNASTSSIHVFMFHSLSIAGTLRGTGSEPLALVVDGNVTITGTIDVSSDSSGMTGTRGSGASCMAPTPGSGSSVSQGGGGAGRFESGGKGGNGGDGSTGPAGGLADNDVDLVPLFGGCDGGTTSESGGACISVGGPGGGAIQIVSRTTITIMGNGVIDASGAGGLSRYIGTCASVGGGGGGSGGAVLLEAPQIILDGAGVVISTKGGGGAAAGAACATCDGHDGGSDATAAAGGTSASLASGGVGGTQAASPGAGANGAASSGDGGGGGGSVGQARFNTTSGAINPQNGAAIRSRSTSGTLATRLVP